MRRALVALFLLIGTMWSAAPAQAEHTSRDMYNNPNTQLTADRWNNLHNEDYCIESDFPNLLTSAEYTNMRNSTANRVNSWESSTDISTDWSLLSAECANNYSFSNYWDAQDNLGNACTNVFLDNPNMASRISYEQLDWDAPSTFAITMDCDFNNDGYIDFFWIVIDRESSGYDLHWNVFANPASGDYDYSGLLMHEFGHATGWYGHWNPGSSACTPTQLALNTMCSDVRGFWNAGVSNGTWFRSLESHDIGEANQAYP